MSEHKNDDTAGQCPLNDMTFEEFQDHVAAAASEEFDVALDELDWSEDGGFYGFTRLLYESLSADFDAEEIDNV